MKKVYRYLAAIVGLFFIINNCFALEQNEKLWLGINSQYVLSQDEKWLGLLFTQFRFINQSHPWQTTLIEGAIGYRLYPDQSIWFGYRWSGHNPNNGFYQENRLFQQYIWQVKPNDLYHFINRSRFEEIQHGDESEIALRFRQRLAVEIKRSLYFSNLFPFLYDEVFIPLNKTDYIAHTFISENRFFLGFNLYQSKKIWWEIGYINQYQMSTPQQSENQMSHIISLAYNFS